MRLTTKEVEWLEGNHPSLLLFNRPGYTVSEGTLNFHRSYKDVEIKDAYRIRLELPYDDNKLPILTETGGRLQKVITDYGLSNPVNIHVYSNWTLCLAAPQELQLKYLTTPNIQLLFDKYIEPYFYSQSFFEKNGSWPWRHLPHGLDGIMEWFRENQQLNGAFKETAKEIHKLAKQGKQNAIRMVARARRRDGFTPNNRCLCGHKRSYLQCHPSYVKLAFAIRATG